MTLKFLVVDEDPTDLIGEDIGRVVLADCEEPETDMELPAEFFQEEEQNVLDEMLESATALESIGRKIACEGMDLSTARELEKVSPGYMRRVGGHAVFTNRPSLEGLVEAQVSVSDRFKDLIARMRKYVVSLFTKFSAWLKARFARPELQDLSQDINEFVAERKNRDAITYLSSLPPDLDESAKEIARFMDGDTQAYSQALADQLEAVAKRVEVLEQSMQDNPVHYRLAKGLVSVQDLFEETAGSLMGQVLFEGSETLNHLVDARGLSNFQRALEAMVQSSAKMTKFKEELVVNTQASSEVGDDREVSLDKLFDNVRKAGDEMKSYSVRTQVADMEKAIGVVIKGADNSKLDDILAIVPQEINPSEHAAIGRQVSEHLRLLSKLGADFLHLWKVRADAVGSINQVGKSLVELVKGFERAVVSAGSSLSSEQKTQLTQALAGKGLRIAF